MSEPTDPSLREALKLSSDYIGPVNSAVVLSLTALDLLTPSLDKWTAKFFAVIFGLLIVLVLYRLYHCEQRRLAQGIQKPLLTLFFGSKGNTIAVFLIPAVALFFWHNVAHAETRGVIADAIPSLQSIQSLLLGVQGDVSDMKSDMKTIKAALNPTDARGKLKALGYGLDDESKAKAIESCDLEALELYVQAGEQLPLATPIFGQRAGSNLEKPLMSNNPKVVQVIQLLAQQHARFDQPFPLTFAQLQTGQIPRFGELGRDLLPLQKSTFSASYVRATPLVVALWAKNDAAVKALLAAGAKDDVGIEAQVPEIKSGLPTGQLIVRNLSTARAEANRLGIALPSPGNT
jgi:hypothetical protein